MILLSAAPRAFIILNGRVPGVPLRSTPGFMLSAAPRAADIDIAETAKAAEFFLVDGVPLDVISPASPTAACGTRRSELRWPRSLRADHRGLWNHNGEPSSLCGCRRVYRRLFNKAGRPLVESN